MTDAAGKPALLIFSHGELLGDALLKLPALSALRPAFPDHHITWLAGSGFSFYARQLKPLVEPLLDEVREDVTLGMSLKEYLRPPPPGFYDVIIDTQNKIKSTLLLKRLQHRRFISSTAAFLFSDDRPDTPHKRGSVQRRLLQLIGLAAGRPVVANYALTLPDEYRSLAGQLLPEGPCYIGLAPGSGVARKCWPLESYIELARRQILLNRAPVFFLGPAEAGWKNRINAECPGCLFPEQAGPPPGGNGVLLSLALAERIAAGVANDSGTGHIFAIAGPPLVSLFGHSNAEKFVQDRAARITLLARDFGGVEMHLIPVDAVCDAIDALLQ
jgi:ADP-heptose:LPS heptosyltransferase